MEQVSEFIPLFTPHITDDDIAAVTRVLKSGMLIQGKEVANLEQTVCSYLGCKHAIATSNGTSTLHLMLHALGIGPGDEVIVPAFSYIATANVVELVGAKPVFVDIKLDTFNIDEDKIEAAITPNTKAIMPVHEFGNPANMIVIETIAAKYNIPVLEDAACAIGSKWNSSFTGQNSYLASFSLHPRKAITSGEGGIITTNNDELADKLRILRNHGTEMIDGIMDFSMAGFNYRLTDFQAALVQNQFSRLEFYIAQKQEMANRYNQLLNSQSIKLPSESENTRHAWQTYHVIVTNRDLIKSQLLEQGIGSNYGAQCMPAMKYYKEKYKLNSMDLFPNAWKAYTCGLALPLYSELTVIKQEKVINTLNKLVKE